MSVPMPGAAPVEYVTLTDVESPPATSSEDGETEQAVSGLVAEQAREYVVPAPPEFRTMKVAESPVQFVGAEALALSGVTAGGFAPTTVTVYVPTSEPSGPVAVSSMLPEPAAPVPYVTLTLAGTPSTAVFSDCTLHELTDPLAAQDRVYVSFGVPSWRSVN
ncbi:MAG TPA: hypothetical protein VFQ38_23500, partial [Longimicrobiales bacterium]|nr:hypothetical protein [Longimicrobiales bacterium]